MSRGSVGTRTGGKGSWRRKAKKTPKDGNQEGLKVWQAAQRLGCRQFGELDTASIMVKDQEDTLHFTKPQLALDGRANTYVLMGKPEWKPMVAVLQELLGGIDLSSLKKDDAKDDLGDVPADVDFSKASEEAAPEGNASE